MNKNTDNAKIYFLILSLRAGGAERQVSELYKALPIEKIICLESGNAYDVPADKIILLSNHHVGISSVIKYLFIPIYLYRLRRKIRPDKNTIIISFLERANLLNALSKFFFKNISIQSIRTNYLNYCIQKKVPKLLQRIIVKGYKYADLIVGNSLGNSADMVNSFGVDRNKMAVVGNFYDANDIIKKSQESLNPGLEKIFKNYKTISFVSRFDDKKGHLHLIRVLAAIKNERQENCKLIFIGDGGLKQKLINLCQLLNLTVFNSDNDTQAIENADVCFMGFQKNPYQFISRSTVFAFPSIFEGLPNALIEAIICGTFCIAADCPSGPREIMTDRASFTGVAREPELTKYGYLMPPFPGELDFSNSVLTAQEKMWKEVLSAVLKKDSKKTIDNAALINLFDKHTITAEWLELINSVKKR